MPGRRRITLSMVSLVGLMLLVSCSRNAGNAGELSRSDFDFLQLGMSYDQVVSQVGEADRDVGSGINLKVYELGDGTEIMLAFPSLDNLAAVYLYNPKSDTRETILGP